MMPSVQSPGGPLAVRTSSFSMAGYVIFSLREIHRNQFSLNKVLVFIMVKLSTQQQHLTVPLNSFTLVFDSLCSHCALKISYICFWERNKTLHYKVQSWRLVGNNRLLTESASMQTAVVFLKPKNLVWKVVVVFFFFGWSKTGHFVLGEGSQLNLDNSKVRIFQCFYNVYFRYFETNVSISCLEIILNAIGGVEL